MLLSEFERFIASQATVVLRDQSHPLVFLYEVFAREVEEVDTPLDELQLMRIQVAFSEHWLARQGTSRCYTRLLDASNELFIEFARTFQSDAFFKQSRPRDMFDRALNTNWGLLMPGLVSYERIYPLDDEPTTLDSYKLTQLVYLVYDGEQYLLHPNDCVAAVKKTDRFVYPFKLNVKMLSRHFEIVYKKLDEKNKRELWAKTFLLARYYEKSPETWDQLATYLNDKVLPFWDAGSPEPFQICEMVGNCVIQFRELFVENPMAKTIGASGGRQSMKDIIELLSRIVDGKASAEEHCIGSLLRDLQRMALAVIEAPYFSEKIEKLNAHQRRPMLYSGGYGGAGPQSSAGPAPGS